MRSLIALALIATSSALISAAPAMAEKMGSTTHVYKDGRTHDGLPRKDAFKGMTKKSVAKWQLCTQGQGMFKSGGKWVNGGCQYPDGTSWR